VWVAAACFIAKEMLCAGCENSWLLAGNLVIFVKSFDEMPPFYRKVVYPLEA
jgi:hypothetical protein